MDNVGNFFIANPTIFWYDSVQGNQSEAARPPVFRIGGKKNPSRRKKGGIMMITYEELFQFCTFIVALIGLCYQIFKDKKD